MLLVLVVVHELGHFYTARKLGVKVLEFGVGFPPRAFGIYTGRTPLIIHPDAVFINLDGPESLRPGQLVKIASTEDPEGNLVACIVEAPRADVSLKNRMLGKATVSDQYGPDHWAPPSGKGALRGRRLLRRRRYAVLGQLDASGRFRPPGRGE